MDADAKIPEGYVLIPVEIYNLLLKAVEKPKISFRQPSRLDDVASGHIEEIDRIVLTD